MHWCANIVCGPEGKASAVLLRAGEIVRGAEVAAQRRPTARRASELARGPARLALALGLDAEVNGTDLCSAAGPVRLESMPVRRVRGVVSGPRVGIAVAQERLWRFWRDGDPTVSAFKAGGRKKGRGVRAD